MRPTATHSLAAALLAWSLLAVIPSPVRAQVPPDVAPSPARLHTDLYPAAPVPALRWGQPIPSDGVRPAAMPGRLVAVRAPIAVHGAPGTTAAALEAARDAAVAALDALERVYHLPQPAPDGTRGGGPELDVYLVPGAPAPADTTVDALEYGALWDRASAFVTLRSDLTGDALRRAAAEGVAHAILLGIDARAPRPWRLALAAAYAARVTELGPDPAAVAAFQRDPGAALLANRDDDLAARGAAIFPLYLAARFDSDDLALLRGMAWIPVARTIDDGIRFADEPDLFDVMTRLFRAERGGLEGVLVDFAVARARTGSEGDTVPLMGWQDDAVAAAVRPAMARSLAFDQLPAWVTPPRMLDETGVAYVTVAAPPRPATATAPRGRAYDAPGIRCWFHGVPWRRWAVTVVLLDAAMREVGRGPANPVARGEWSSTVLFTPEATQALFVINDFGNGDYDPDDLPDRNGFFALNLARDAAPDAGAP